MSVFEYIVSIHSIVLGLATASLLSAFAEQLKYGDVGRYWLHSAWSLTLLFFIVSGWWGYWYSFSELETITIFTFLYSFQFSIAMYLCARLLSPDPVREARAASMEDYFFRVKTPFLSIFLYGLLTWVLASPLGMLGTRPHHDMPLVDIIGILFFTVLIVSAIIFNHRWLQGVVVCLVLLLQILGEVAQGGLGL